MKLSKLMQTLQVYKDNLTFDPDVYIDSYPAIDVGFNKNWGIELGKGIKVDHDDVRCETVVFKYKYDSRAYGYPDGHYLKIADSHGALNPALNQYTISITGEYDIGIEYSVSNPTEKKIEVWINFHKDNTKLMEGCHRFNLGPNDSTVVVKLFTPKFLRAGDILTINHNYVGDIRYLLEVRKR